jgi:hypothetical protein
MEKKLRPSFLKVVPTLVIKENNIIFEANDVYEYVKRSLNFNQFSNSQAIPKQVINLEQIQGQVDESNTSIDKIGNLLL